MFDRLWKGETSMLSEIGGFKSARPVVHAIPSHETDVVLKALVAAYALMAHADGELANAEYETYETFNLHVPKTCPGVPDEMLNPAKSWTGSTDFKEEVTKLGKLFNENFEKYASEATEEVIKAGPVV